MPTPAPSIDTLPPAPIRGQAGFSAATGTFLSALPDFGDQVDAAGQAAEANATETAELAAEIAAAALVAADAAGLVGKSTSTLSVSAGSKAVTLVAAKASLAVAGKRVAIVNASDPSIKMFGNIASSPTPTSTTFTVTVTSNGYTGTGSYSTWEIIDAAFFATGATAAEERAGTSDVVASTPKGQTEAMAIDTLTDAATTAWDMAVKGPNAKWTLGGDNTMGAPTNLKDGLVYSLTINPATHTPAWNAIFNFGAAGPPSLPASVWSKLAFQYDETRDLLDVVGVFRGA